MHSSMPSVHVQTLPHFPPTNSLPTYQSEDAAGMDIQAAQALVIGSGQSAVVKTGLAFAVPVGYEMQVRSRSGLAAKHAVFVTNGIGTIDADYRGEVMVLLTNLGRQAFSIAVGDRIGQLVFAPTYRPNGGLRLVPSLPTTARGSGGLGSTG